MLTRQGWLVGAGAVGLICMGRVLGVVELFVLGAAAGVLLVFAVASVAFTRLRLEVRREVTPTRVHAGTPSRVQLHVRNRGARRTPVLRLLDPVSGTRGAELMIGPLEPVGSARAAYRLPTERRGIVRIGPLDVELADPFGLVATSTDAAPRAELTVYPRVDTIAPLPQTTGHDPLAGADHPTSLGRSGEDFYALRQYVMGDDLRRVHWPATARNDDLMVRQDELPWQGRVTVLLDVRRNTHHGESLEIAVSAAASIVTASWRRRDLVRLISTDGTDSGFAAGSAHVEAVMEHLATVQAASSGTFKHLVESLLTSSSGGGLVVIVAGIPDAELDSLARLRSRFGSLTIVAIDPSTWDRNAPVGPAPAATSSLLPVTRDIPFATAWNARFTRPRLGAVAR